MGDIVIDKKKLQLTVMAVLLGTLMLVFGLKQLVVYGPRGISSTLSGVFFFSRAPVFWTWALILSQIIFGALVIARWKIKFTAIPLMIIHTISIFVVAIDWHLLGKNVINPVGYFTYYGLGQFVKYLGIFLDYDVIFHLIAILGYWIIISESEK